MKPYFMNFHAIFRYFIRGLLFVVPVAVTIAVVLRIIQWVDGWVPVAFPGLGLLIVFGITVFIGFIGNTILARPIVEFFGELFKKIPLINFVYNTVNDLVGALSGDKKKFTKPVLVAFDDSGTLYKPGFITQDDLSALSDEDMVAVYFPHSYNFSGNLFLVRRKNIKKVSGSSTEIMKFILSGGMTGEFGKF